MENKIKTFEDACKKLGIDFKEPKGLEKDELAYLKIKIIVKALNDGWEPDWHDHDQWKYYPWFWMGDQGESVGVGFTYFGCASDNSYSLVGSRLCLKSRELAKYAGEQFNDLYKYFFLI